MCDWSMEAVKSRSAEVGDKLVVATFTGASSKGLADVNDADCAVCLKPGTEIAFDNNIKKIRWYGDVEVTSVHKVAKFVQVDMEMTCSHHDAFELPDGEIIKIQHLAIGQTASVLQLPHVAEVKETVDESEMLTA